MAAVKTVGTTFSIGLFGEPVKIEKRFYLTFLNFCDTVVKD